VGGGGQACVLHASVLICSDAAGHAAPPQEGGVTTARLNVCMPPPHVAEHWPDGMKLLMTQSTLMQGGGHAYVLHASDLTFSDSAGHALPPCAADRTPLRVNVC